MFSKDGENHLSGCNWAMESAGFEIMDDSQRICIMSVRGIIEVATVVIGDDPECRVLINGQLKISQR
jgi:hypothetical protein